MSGSHEVAEVSGPWAGGWLIAAIAGIFAVLMARTIGEVGTGPAALVGVVTFAVHGLLLGSGGVERTAAPDDGHGDHGH